MVFGVGAVDAVAPVNCPTVASGADISWAAGAGASTCPVQDGTRHDGHTADDQAGSPEAAHAPVPQAIQDDLSRVGAGLGLGSANGGVAADAASIRVRMRGVAALRERLSERGPYTAVPASLDGGGESSCCTTPASTPSSSLRSSPEPQELAQIEGNALAPSQATPLPDAADVVPDDVVRASSSAGDVHVHSSPPLAPQLPTPRPIEPKQTTLLADSAAVESADADPDGNGEIEPVGAENSLTEKACASTQDPMRVLFKELDVEGQGAIGRDELLMGLGRTLGRRDVAYDDLTFMFKDSAAASPERGGLENIDCDRFVQLMNEVDTESLVAKSCFKEWLKQMRLIDMLAETFVDTLEKQGGQQLDIRELHEEQTGTALDLFVWRAKQSITQLVEAQKNHVGDFDAKAANEKFALTDGVCLSPRPSSPFPSRRLSIPPTLPLLDGRSASSLRPPNGRLCQMTPSPRACMRVCAHDKRLSPKVPSWEILLKLSSSLRGLTVTSVCRVTRFTIRWRCVWVWGGCGCGCECEARGGGIPESHGLPPDGGGRVHPKSQTLNPKPARWSTTFRSTRTTPS